MLANRLSTRIPFTSLQFLHRFILSACLALSINPALSLSNEAPNNTLLLLSGESSVYHQVADETIRIIQDKCVMDDRKCQDMKFEKSIISNHSDFDFDAKLIITFGTKAATKAHAYGGNHLLIRAMLPEQSSIDNKDNSSKHDEIDVFIDQPYSRYFKLIRSTLPRARRVGLLLHESNKAILNPLKDAASNSGLALHISIVKSTAQTGKHLSRLLDDIDVFLAIPDSRIHNNKTIPNILTTSYRNNIPVIGFSSAYVRAGAIAAVYTSLDNIAQQVAETAYKSLNKIDLPLHSKKAEYFSISFNFDVARSLGITIPAESEVRNSFRSGLKQ